MLGGRSNTNLFSSPTQSARLPHTTISVEQNTTGGLDEGIEREEKSARSFSSSLSLSPFRSVTSGSWFTLIVTYMHIRIDYLQQPEQSRYGAFGEKKRMNA